MTYIIEVLRQEHRNIESLLRVLERELSVFDRGEHREGTRRLRRVAQAVERVLSDQDLVRQNVDNIIRDFINHERQHMAMEERVVFPAALDALRPEDWADIALRLADRYDPFYQAGFDEKFNKLRRNILKMEEETEAERPA